MDKISVIVPFYNVEKYAAKCIESITRQTFENLEIILVDDGSPDNCGKICDEYAKKDNRIKVIHKENGGLSDARNVGLQEATGKYIGFVDSDDYIQNDMYEYLYKLIKDNDADISICGVQEIYENENVTTEELDEIIERYDKKEAIQELLLDQKIRSHAWDKLYKRELFDNIQYPIGRKMEDIATTYRLFERSDKIVVSNQVKYYYLQRSNGIMLSKSTKMWVDYYELSLERYNYLKNKYPDMIENDVSMLILIMYLFAVENREFEEYLKKNKVKKFYDSIYNKNILKSKNIRKSLKIRIKILRINSVAYKIILKLYLKIKGE